MAIALVHAPVVDRRGDRVCAALTNLDLHDLARLATTYGLARFYLVIPAAEQQALARRIIGHWREGFGASYNVDRSQALSSVVIVDRLEDAEADWRQTSGESEALTLLTGARHAVGLDFAAAQQVAGQQSVLLVFGTGHGLADELYLPARQTLQAVRSGGYNHLSVRTAAAIILDRLVGESGRVVMPDSLKTAPVLGNSSSSAVAT